MKNIISIIIIILSFSLSLNAQREEKFIRRGNKLYKGQKYKDAEIDYRKSLLKDSTKYKGQFNLGDALYKQKNYKETSKIFRNITERNFNKLDNINKAKVYHNFGNSLLQDKKYAQSINAYENALRNNPDDKDTKYNLAYAQKMLKIEKKQNKKNKKGKNKKGKNKKQKQQKEKQNKNKKQQEKSKQQKSQQKKKQQKLSKQISRKDAERMLEALKNNEKITLKKLKKQKAKANRVRVEKDW